MIKEISKIIEKYVNIGVSHIPIEEIVKDLFSLIEFYRITRKFYDRKK
jgi:septum formation topological specificity factor MinE